MRKVYLDYAATTPVKKEVLDEMIPYFTEKFGNPSSLYEIGADSKEAITKARGQVAGLIGAEDKEVIFTSCGSESDNWALIGTAEVKKSKGNHIITTAIEHHAILHTCKYLEKQGFEVTYLGVDSDGRINLSELEAAITDKTILISIMFINNEMGAIQPIKEIADVAKKHGILFHTDAVQAVGNIEIDVKELGVDMMSMSAHKIYGPKGVGALYVRKGVMLPGFIHGGAQEFKKRAGTESVPNIVGFGKAAELAKEGLSDHIARLTELRDYLIKEVTSKIPDVDVNGGMKYRHPGNVNLTFNYIEGESLLILLDMKGICISTGSACSSASLVPSHVLSALGVPVEKIHGSLRFSIGDFTTKEELDYTVENLIEIVTKLRAISSVSSEKGW
ncbi:cysteine desulfurase NifS [Sinanaerobacter sp. ZZT-01]|uniref:cysteine desulfurase NifS n=1 Tax=Sinanaerobacter sp. ZZT-01 TaxID=3111540 RepID=UPI002D7655A6|nr:cysteine desulfurase NifS [Sinanaerobacter sp. ZZT-01]WRR93092.1 cysteine desulfurase NifS [Sinanaerobacter sp. ZZT-01]